MPSAIPPIQGEGLPVAVNDAPTKGHPSTVKETGLASSSRASSSDDENLDKTSKNPFADPVIAAHWRSVYEKAQYESRHVLDEELEWTEKEEKRIVRKLDFRVCLWACVMFFALNLDRSNITQALSDNMLDDLGLNTDDYNYGQTVFYLSFLLAELPSQLVSKAVGPDRWIPAQICMWSIVAALQCQLSGRGSFLATRALLGILEGGFIPDLVLWLSYFYTSRELPIRLSIFWTTLSLTSIASSFLAYGLLHLRGHMGWGGWQWLFLIEGLLTFAIGFASFFMMPASAVQTKTWFRPNGWFDDREVAIVVNRVLRDDPSKGDMHNRQAITPRRLWDSMRDYDLWPLYAIGLIGYIAQTPADKYQTLIIKSIGFDTFTTNLLTIPAYVAHICTLLLLTRLSDWLNERVLVASLQAAWTFPLVITLFAWSGTGTSAWGTYAVLEVLLSYPYCHAIIVALVSRNSNNVGARSVSSALYNMSVQVGNIAAMYIYRDDDKPVYRRGNKQLIAVNAAALVVFFLAKFYYVYRNKQRDQIWNAMTPEERADYTRNTKLEGSRRLDFRFAH